MDKAPDLTVYTPNVITMRITIITGPFMPTGKSSTGAVEKLWLGLANVFASKGHQVNIVARKWPGDAPDENVDHVRFIRCGGFKRSSSIFFDLAKDFLYSLRVLSIAPRSDITVVNTFWLPILAPLRKRTLGKTVVNVARFPKGQMKLYRSADRLSVVSAAVARAVTEQAPEVARLVKVIHNPVDINCFAPSNTLPPRNNSFRVLYTGRVHPEKGLHLLIPALVTLIREFPAIELAIVGAVEKEHGGGGEAYVLELIKLACGLKVSFEPAIADPFLLANRMRNADYYCYPSLADQGESFGVAPLEAMALGYAPILSNLDCFRDFSESGVNSFVFDHRDPDPVSSLASAIRRAMSAPDTTRKMGESAFITAKRFNYESIAQAYLDDWQKL